jgi:hypothetical protein
MSESNLAVLENPQTALKFASATLPVYRTTEMATVMFESQKLEFSRSVMAINNWQNISTNEIYRVFMASCASGLSWALEEKNFYMIPRGGGIDLQITYRGETSLRIAQGQFERLDGPYCIYEGDEIIDLDRANAHIKVKEANPRQPKAKVIGVYLFIVFKNGSRSLRYFQQQDFDRWMAASARQNGGRGANALYSSYNGGIDPGFAEGKCIKHSYRGLPKCKTLAGMKYETEIEASEEQHFETTYEVVSPETPSAPAQEVRIQQNNEFDF